MSEFLDRSEYLTRRDVLAGAAGAACAAYCATIPETLSANEFQMSIEPYMVNFKVGDLSPAAVGYRLNWCRRHRNDEVATIEAVAKRIDATPAELAAWEKGEAMIPARNAWLFANRFYGPVEFLLTGESSCRDLPDYLPKLGDDLSGFASRIKQARERLGFTIRDVKLASDELEIPANRWQQWERGIDEPSYDEADRLADALEVTLEWLYTETPADSVKTVASRRNLGIPSDHEFAVPDSYEHISDRMRKARSDAGLSVAQVVAILGQQCTEAELLEIEGGDCGYINEEYALALAMLYGVRLEWLQYGDDGLAIIARRLERFKRRLGVSRPQVAIA